MPIITIDGVKTKLIAADLDNDGRVGGIENIQQTFPDQQNIIQNSELKDSLQELNKDNIDITTRQSGIDMRARLHYIEIQNLLALDALVSLSVLPTRCLAFSRQKKRLSVSEAGKGREEIVQLVAGKRELEAKTGILGDFGSRFKSFMGMGQNNEQK